MNRVGAIVAASVIVVAAPQALLAQPDGRLSIVGAIEHARITEDDGYLGAGFGGAGGLQFHLTDATSLEIEIGQERHVRDVSYIKNVVDDAQGRPQPLLYTERRKGTATFVLGLVSRTFGSARARPVIWGGGGLMSHGGMLVQPGDAEARRGSGSNAFAMDGGAGVDVRFTGRLTIRPFAGLRLVNTDNFGPKYIIRSGARIGFRW